MSEAELWAEWRLWMLVAAFIVLAAAALLIVIWLEARAILRHAVRALHAGEEIRANTQCLWELQTTNEVAEKIATTVEDIRTKGGALALALEGALTSGDGGGGR